MSARAHLHRLSTLWVENPLYFVTQNTAGRRRILHLPASAGIVRRALADADKVHGWAVGKFVIMPDHIHFFVRARPGAKSLSNFMRDWKRWTAREILAAHGLRAPLWQAEFFDHALRSANSYAEKWEYVRLNPLRAGLVLSDESWPHEGEIHALTY
ncbi:MAG: hypothetical protein C0502_00465 [Opitutus sp.]|nr:hypothetical protein [Opitutus sp.]